jgi:hypothetical protein
VIGRGAAKLTSIVWFAAMGLNRYKPVAPTKTPSTLTSEITRSGSGTIRNSGVEPAGTKTEPLGERVPPGSALASIVNNTA